MESALQGSAAEPPLQHIAELQSYIGYSPEDAQRVRGARRYLQPHIPPLIDDFYAEIERHADTRSVLTGGAAQIERLKGSLRLWLDELLGSDDGDDYIRRRWRVGLRHSEIGLDQIYALAALARLRRGLCQRLYEAWQGSADDLLPTVLALNKRLDLDLIIIEASYQSARQAQQQRTERLAAIGQMAGGLAHELRNPLNVIKTSAYYLQRARDPAPSKVETHLERIERQVRTADDVITALSNFARMPMPILEPVRLRQLLQQVFEQEGLQAEAPSDTDSSENNNQQAGLQLTLDLPDDLQAVKADSMQLAIVFGNLIRNAREAMPEGGNLQVWAQPEDGHIEINFSDNGPGVSPEDLPRILEPLYTTKARGIGLGLALCRGILEKHHGQLSVTSLPGQGATFTVRLPAANVTDSTSELPVGQPAGSGPLESETPNDQ